MAFLPGDARQCKESISRLEMDSLGKNEYALPTGANFRAVHRGAKQRGKGVEVKIKRLIFHVLNEYSQPTKHQRGDQHSCQRPGNQLEDRVLAAMQARPSHQQQG